MGVGLEQAYAIESIPLFSSQAKRELRYFRKLYNADVSLNSIRQTAPRWDYTHNLENVVYNELIYRDYEVSVFVKDGREIDFLAQKDGREYLIQVAYSIRENETYEREFALFSELDQSRRKIMITADEEDYSTSTVLHLNLEKFLLAPDLPQA
ncbi:MAG: ATP-binding protein [Duodenibacillus sp.]|nr:ATP-binding protein [Duodenibacillus sp.]